MRLKDKVVVVTGAGTGIGQAAAVKFAEEGAKVVVGYHREGADETLDQIKKLGGQAVGVQCDVTKLDDIKNLMKTAKDEFGSLDILINNAGVSIPQTLLEMTEDVVKTQVNVNFTGMVFCASEAAKIMAEQKSGTIINTSSIGGIYGGPGASIYYGTKAAINMFTSSWAKELGPLGIRVSALAPGLTKTSILECVPEEHLQGIIQAAPLRRINETEDVANAFVFLASDDARNVTGAVLEVSAGMTNT